MYGMLLFFSLGFILHFESVEALYAERISALTKSKFSGEDVSRVLDCWDNFSRGVKFEKFLDNKEEILQTAECYVKGLSAKPFHDINLYPWASRLAKDHEPIFRELKSYNQKLEEQKKAEQSWLGPRDALGGEYGPGWKTLGLQDRGVWDLERVDCFPFTVGRIKQLEVPSCEVFFARQAPGSGIKPHSDKNNFIITCHVGLDVPEGECWLKVGNEKYFWKNGEAVVFDTSIIHSTENSSEKDRNVLLIRLWHPELSFVERQAFQFIFDYCDQVNFGDAAVEQFEMMHLMMGKDKPNVKATKTNVKDKKMKKEKKVRGKGFA